MDVWVPLCCAEFQWQTCLIHQVSEKASKRSKISNPIWVGHVGLKQSSTHLQDLKLIGVGWNEENGFYTAEAWVLLLVTTSAERTA